MFRWIKNLSISQKLFFLVGIFVALVVLEVASLRFAFTTLTALRSTVSLQAQWSTAQKHATLSLYMYSVTHDPIHYQDFLKYSRVPAGMKKARAGFLACENIRTCESRAIIADGMLEAGLPPEEIPNMILLIRWLRGLPRMGKAADLWARSDDLYDEVVREGALLHQEIQSPKPSRPKIDQAIRHVAELNDQFSANQAVFAKHMGAGSRAIEGVLGWIILFTTTAFGGAGVAMLVGLIRYFRNRIAEVKDVALGVGQGDLGRRIPVHSRDELGQMAQGLNQMIEDLQTSIGRSERAESANQVKSLFLANMSHEVRTPMGVILGLVEVLKDPELTGEERQKYLGIIEQTGKNLQQIINDILDISKVEAGHLDIYQTVIELKSFIEDLNLNLQVLARRGQNRLLFEINQDFPSRFLVDQVRLRQILTNLIGNALKFTHEGEVVVSFVAEGDRFIVRVKDTGIGIDDADRHQLFKPFSQVDRAANRKYGGTGLGLVLSRRLAEYMGGDLDLETSQKGVGSTFRLRLPLMDAQAQQVTAKQDSHGKPSYEVLRGKRILLVEDSVDNQMLVKILLGKKNAFIDCANNGREGVEMAKAGTYDLVLMDMQMPVVDGYTATEELRRMGLKLPIIALTAHAMKEDRERCLRVGCNEYLTKPIDPPLFFKTLASFLEPQSTSLPI